MENGISDECYEVLANKVPLTNIVHLYVVASV